MAKQVAFGICPDGCHQFCDLVRAIPFLQMPTGAGNEQNPNSTNVSIKKGTARAHLLEKSLNLEPQVMCQETAQQTNVREKVFTLAHGTVHRGEAKAASRNITSVCIHT